MVPELGLPAESAKFYHGKGEVKIVGLGLLDYGFVEGEGGLVLWRGGGDQPPIVALNPRVSDQYCFKWI